MANELAVQRTWHLMAWRRGEPPGRVYQVSTGGRALQAHVVVTDERVAVVAGPIEWAHRVQPDDEVTMRPGNGAIVLADRSRRRFDAAARVGRVTGEMTSRNIRDDEIVGLLLRQPHLVAAILLACGGAE